MLASLGQSLVLATHSLIDRIILKVVMHATFLELMLLKPNIRKKQAIYYE